MCDADANDEHDPDDDDVNDVFAGKGGSFSVDGQVPPLLVPGWPRGEAQRCLGNASQPIFATSFSNVFVRRLLGALNRFWCSPGLPKIVQIW